MADCHFQYLPPRVTASMQRASIEFRRSVARAPVFSVPLISIFLHVASLAVRRLSLSFSAAVLYRYIHLSRFRQLQQLREIMEKPRGETEITDVLPACGVEIDGGVASMADGGGRDEERKMSGTRGEIDREREREGA